MPKSRSGDAIVTFPSRLGWMALLGRGKVLKQLTFGHATPRQALAALDAELADEAIIGDWNPGLVKRLQAFAEGRCVDFSNVPLAMDAYAPFARRVVECCRAIPFGQQRTYGELAAEAGSPRAARAVGNVMATNPTPLIVPCHRVVPSGGDAGHYSAGAGRRTKLRLLEQEALTVTRRRRRAMP